MGFPSRIFLTGFMASGKSTVGPILADLLGYTFIDMDAIIVEDAGRSIPEIFDDEGEPGFRRRERAVLEEVTTRTDVVVGTGGGALATREGMAQAASCGLVVYLDADEETILLRLAATYANRPLLAGKDQPPRVIRRLLAERRPYYEQAHLRVRVDDRPPQDIAEEIMRRLGG